MSLVAISVESVALLKIIGTRHWVATISIHNKKNWQDVLEALYYAGFGCFLFSVFFVGILSGFTVGQVIIAVLQGFYDFCAVLAVNHPVSRFFDKAATFCAAYEIFLSQEL